MKKLILLFFLISSCSLKFQGYYEPDFEYKYIELPSQEIKIGKSDEMYLPGDTIVEYPTMRTFVIKSMRLRGDLVWINK